MMMTMMMMIEMAWLDLTWFIQHHRCTGPHVDATNVCLQLMLQPLPAGQSHSLEVLLHYISPVHPWPARSFPESCNFPVQRLLRNAYFIHSRDTTKSSHPSFSDHLLKTFLSCSCPYFFICNFVPPGDTKNASQPPAQLNIFTLNFLKWNLKQHFRDLIFVNYFVKLLIFIIKQLKTFKSTIKVHEVSRRHIMLLTNDNRYLPLTALLTYSITAWFEKYFMRYFRPKKISWNFTTLDDYMNTVDC